ncbi:MAG: extracellular solute-binding protein [bacterium]|nr:extracellular solute-binding protein [bacterium]MCM1375498.1 extracellular solute-binding protein [Muribaculum sp.]
MHRERMAALATIVLLALAACGRSGVPGAEEASPVSDADTYAYLDEEWIVDDRLLGPPYPLYLSEVVEGVEMQYEGKYDSHSTEYVALGNSVYWLDGFHRQIEEGWERHYYISSYDGGGDVLHSPVELPAPEEYGAYNLAATSFDVRGERELVLFLQGWQRGERKNSRNTSCYLAMHVTPEGEILSVTDLYPAMRELGIETNYAVDTAYVDAAGYYYLIHTTGVGGDGRDVHILSPEGKTVGAMNPGEGYAEARWAMKLPDGSPVFCWTNQETYQDLMAVYNREENALRILLEKVPRRSWLWTPTRDGYLYYVDGWEGNLNRCDIRTGKVEACLYYPKLGMEESERSVRIIIGENGEPELLGRRDGQTVICRLSTEKPETEALRLVSSYGGFSNYAESCGVAYSQKHLNCPAQMEYMEYSGEYPSEQEEEAYWQRATAGLVSGKGADLYYVNKAQMLALQEKGVLADLSELISEETLEALWPATLEEGTVEGHLMGISPVLGASTMMVSDEIWPEERWTLQEALDVIEAYPQISYPLAFANFTRIDRSRILECLVLRSLRAGGSPFLDLEAGSCDFDNPLFIRALEVVGACKEQFDYEEVDKLYQEKDWLAVEVSLVIDQFADRRNELGENYHVVGYPTEGESGTYCGSGYYWVVNKDTEHMQEAAEFLEELLSYKNQSSIRSSASPARKDMYQQERLVPFHGSMAIDWRDGIYKILEPGPEGDYRFGELRAVWESAVVAQYDTDAIEEIILEEASACFSGVRDAAATAGIIQNRVQLYLKERQ